MSLTVENLSFSYPNGKEVLKNITLEIGKNERIGLIAPSGYGKSTLAKILAGIYLPTSGQIYCEVPLSRKGHPYPVQLIYQHPEKTFNPRWKMKKVIEETGKELSSELLAGLGIKRDWFERYPHELSGGELQRFAVARALSVETAHLIADEISTMLDVVTQAQIWQFILDYVEKHDIGLLVMSHNPRLLERICTSEIELVHLNQL